ncbi:MAG TPA: hypothetical protein VHL80_01665 [Polyangia bacterium]|nr:hypothetical protein [Polyangia bacterium]
MGCGGGNNNGDGGKKYPDATVTFDGASDQQGAGGTGNTSGTGGASGAGAADAGAPPIGTGSKLIVAGNITMIGSGQDSCTNQVPPSSDRWCGFARLSADLVDYELWVVDVSKVAEGVTVSCTGGDASCVRLSTGLYVDATNGFRVHGFDGDTLTYEEVPSSSGGGFLGNIFAWRPGWTQPRNLTGNNGLVCNGHALGKAAVCIQNPAPDATQMFVHTAELHAGILDDSNTPLPLIDTIIVVASATEANNGVTKWSARLTPDGKSIAWSTRATDTGTEDLHVQALGSQTKVDVAQDASQWDISADMAKWYWLKAFNYGSSGAPSGTLQTAPFPGGATPVTLAQNVGDFTTAGGGVFYRTQVATATGAGNLLLTADPAVPATVAMIDSSVEFVFGTSPDGKNVTYTKNVQSLASGLFLFDVYVGNSVGNMPCTLTSMPTAFMPPIYLGGGSLVAWGRVNSLTNQLEGVTTSLPGCVTRKFATDIFDWQAVGDEGLVYLDEVNSDPTVDEATLRYGKIAQGVLPSPGNVVQERAGLTFSALLPSLNAVVYPISTHTSADGLYINTMLPFTVTSSVPDGGTTTTDAAPMDTGGGAVDTDAGTSDATPGG